MNTKTTALKKQKGFAVLLTLISLVAMMATQQTIWALLFFAGLGWFVVIRIRE